MVLIDVTAVCHNKLVLEEEQLAFTKTVSRQQV